MEKAKTLSRKDLRQSSRYEIAHPPLQLITYNHKQHYQTQFKKTTFLEYYSFLPKIRIPSSGIFLDSGRIIA